VIRLVNPDELSPPRGFSHAVDSAGERTLWVAGQIGDRPDGTLDEGLVDQFRRALANVATCMDEAGFPPDSLVRMMIYTTDLAGYRSNLGALGEAYREHFGRHFPAVALLGVSELFDPAAKVELVCTAVL